MFKKIKNRPRVKEIEKIIYILKQENKNSILANLSHKNIINFFSQVVASKELELYIAINTTIIGYAITAKKPEYLIKNFEKMKYFFFLDLLIKLKLLTLTNVVISKLNIDSLFLSKKNDKLVSESYNLNLLAIERKYQSKGIGKKFLSYIINDIKKKKGKFISCETNDERSNEFYKKKLRFKNIGNKFRFPKLMKIMIKKL